jgi:hypothetical protein
MNITFRRTHVLVCATALLFGASWVSPQAVPAAQAAVPQYPAEAFCSSYAPPGLRIVRKFCDGPATLHLTINGKPRTITGGVCDSMMGMRSFNAGIAVIDHAVEGGPDYVGVTFTGGTPSVAIHLDGKRYIFTTRSGSMTDKGGAFDAAGNSLGPDHAAVAVHGSFVCSKP